MTPLVSQLWPQFMADPDFAACFGRVVVEHAQMLRQERQVIFTPVSYTHLLIDDELVVLLQCIREHFGKPVHITSGYRTAEHNAAVGGSKSSQHLLLSLIHIWCRRRSASSPAFRATPTGRAC